MPPATAFIIGHVDGRLKGHRLECVAGPAPFWTREARRGSIDWILELDHPPYAASARAVEHHADAYLGSEVHIIHRISLLRVKQAIGSSVDNDKAWC